MSLFKRIYYPTMLHESLRDYYCINKNGQLSFLYKFLLCVLMPLQTEWDKFELYRQKIYLISICKWQLGQLTNVLNALYDSTLNRIFLSQSTIQDVFDPVITGNAINFDPVFAESTSIFEPVILDEPRMYPMVIHIPAAIMADSINYADLISTVEKIRPLGLDYNIETF